MFRNHNNNEIEFEGKKIFQNMIKKAINSSHENNENEQESIRKNAENESDAESHDEYLDLILEKEGKVPIKSSSGKKRKKENKVNDSDSSSSPLPKNNSILKNSNKPNMKTKKVIDFSRITNVKKMVYL